MKKVFLERWQSFSRECCLNNKQWEVCRRNWQIELLAAFAHFLMIMKSKKLTSIELLALVGKFWRAADWHPLALMSSLPAIVNTFNTFINIIISIVREASFCDVLVLYGHCPNSFSPHPPSVKRANVEKKCSKPTWQAFTPPLSGNAHTETTHLN